MPPQPQQTTDGPQDPQVLTVVKTIRKLEGGDYENRTGDNGSSAGAYQWNNDNKPLAPGELPSHWKSAAGQYLGDPNAPMTRENQNKVAYSQVAAYKAQGLSPIEIDALWNGAHKDAATGKYVHNSSTRATQFQQALQEQIGQGGTQSNYSYNPKPFSSNPGQFNFSGEAAPAQTGDPQNPGFFKGLQEDITGTNPQSIPTQLMNTAKGAGNFLFPIVGDVYHDVKGDSSKTGLQQVGDAALSALPFIPGLGEGGLAAKAGTAAALGYGAGTAANLSQGQSIGKAITPQLSNVGGAVLGGGTAGVLSKLGGNDPISKMESAYADALGATKTGVRAASKVTGRGETAPAKFLSSSGLPPETAEVNGRRIFTTGEDSQTYQTLQKRANDLTQLRDDLIDSTPSDSKVSLNALQGTALQQTSKDFIGTERAQVQSHINKEFNILKTQFGGDSVTLKDLNTIKKYFQGNTNFDTTRPSTITEANKMVSSLVRQNVEKHAENSGIPGIGDLNKLIRQHLDYLNTDGKKGILDKLNGQVVKGGRIGTHVKEVVGGGIGGALGGTLGGGPIGEAGGAIAGSIGGNMVSKLLQHFAVGGPGFASKIEKLSQEDPQLVQQLQAILEKRTGKIGGMIAPQVSNSAKSGLIPSLITKGAARVGAGL